VWLWNNIVESVLDVGCGTCLDADRFDDYVGCDVTRESLVVAHRNHKVENVVCCDARHLPFRPDKFKSVFSKDLLLHHSHEDMMKVIHEMLRLNDKIVVAWGIEEDGTCYLPSYEPLYKMKAGFHYNRHDLAKLEEEFDVEIVNGTSVMFLSRKV